MSKRIKKTQIRSQKSEILTYFQTHTDRAYTLTDLYNHLKVYDDQDKMFVRLMVEDLVDEGKIHAAGRGRYTVKQQEKEELITGKLDFVNPSFGFVRYDEEQADIYIARDDMFGALDGDTVKAQILKKQGKREKNPEGRIVEIVTRARNTVVGKVKVFRNYALVSPDVKGFHENIFVPIDQIFGATSDDLVIVELVTYPQLGIQASGKIVAVLGKSGDNNAEMNAIMAEFGLPVDFPKAVEEQAKGISEEISAEEIKKRRDVRDILTFTIDPHDAKDFDDALSYRVLENGHYEIGIHIADVSHYVRPGTLLEEEALKRATSVYLVDRTIPMLPEKLSNNLCSLRPNEDKLVFSAIFEMNDEAEVLKEWFGRCVMHSDRRFSYEEAQEVLDGQEDPMYAPVLKKLNDMAHRLRDERFKKGAFNFETDEVKFRLDENGKPLGIYQKVRKDAHKLIEEFMLLANKRVATFVHNKGPKSEEHYTMVYRVHEPPNPSKLETFVRFASKMGFSIKSGNTEQLSRSLNNLMTEIEGKPIQNILESLAVRTMSKARYSTQNLGHFGLAFEHYSHFTSPIRRYPDVMAHRMLQHYLDGGKSLPAEEFERKAEHSSAQEKLAADAERASIKYKQVEYMSLQSRNEVYTGLVSGVTDFGLFVELEGMGAEGMVRLADLTDDYFEFDADNYRVVGRKSNRIIGFGQEVKVKVKSTDLDRRSIDLELVGMEGKAFAKKPLKPKPRRGKIPAPKKRRK